MNNNINEHQPKLGTIIILIIITAIVSGLTSGIIVYSSYSKTTGISYKSISDDNNLKEFLEVYSQVSNDYYENVNKKELIKAAISAMLSYLDDNYTIYMNEKETDKLDESLMGTYYGIGVYINEHTIVEVFKNSPAAEAGLLKNDEIIKINGESVEDLTASDIASKIRNSNLKEISMVVKRGSEEKTLQIKLKTLYVPAVESKIIDNTKIGYLSISKFSSTITNQVNDVLNEFNNKNITSLIIDLRSNTGGFLSSAENVSNLFLEKGKVIYSLESKNKKDIIKDNTDMHTDYKIVVLIDENTASAAEIFAAALKDSYNATLVGKKSYGKGKVQQTLRLSDGSMAKYTSAKWFRPNGECVDEKGIEPDYDIDLEITTDNNTKTVSIVDKQIEKAIELLSK